MPVRSSLAEQLTTAIADLEPVARPLVLVGSDSGAAAIAALVARAETSAAWWPQAVMLAGAARVRRPWSAQLG